MIIGNGDIAKVLKPYDRADLLFFASGVSDSQCTDIREFNREIELLNKYVDCGYEHIVYFGSLSIYDKNTDYTRHKLIMEGLIKSAFKVYTIIRLGNITWGTNPNTVINFLKRTESPTIRDEYKYICTIDDFFHWIDRIPNYSNEMNITGERVHMEDLYNRVKNKII